VAVVVVVVVQAVEGRFLPIIQGTVHIVVLHTDTGMIFVRVVAVGYKQYVADERIQAVAHPNAVFVRLAGKVGFYLTLGVKLRTHPVDFPRVRRFDEGLLHVVGVRTEHLSEEIFVYIRFQELIAEGESVAFYLFTCHGQGGYKLPQQAMYGVHRDFPDAEEAEDVVDAIGVEVFSHFAEALHPPCITVFFHDIPVIGGEAPVLSVHREIVGWCAGLSVQVEIMGFCPCFYAVATDADGDVAFQYDAVGACVFSGGK